MRVLLVDDNPLDLTMLRFLTGDINALIEEGESVEEAIEAVQRFNFDLILTDFELADGQATELLHFVRKFSPQTRVWCISASVGSTDFTHQRAQFDRIYAKHQDFKKLQADFGGFAQVMSRA